MRYRYSIPILTVFVAVSLYAASPGTWTTLAPVPHQFSGVEGMSVGVVGNKIIAAFGHDGFDRSTTRIYDIATDTWSFGADGPGPNSESVAVTHGGKLYSIGGRLFGPRNDIHAYDIETDTWDATLTPMPTGRVAAAAATVGNAIYVIGGRSSTGGPCTGGALAVVERYDIDADVWTTVAPLPAPRSDLAAATVGGKIYVFGGCTTQFDITNAVDVYDPVTDTWSSAPADMPTRRAGMYGVASKGGTVYVIGGWDGVQPGLHTNEAYKVASDSWSTATPMPTNRAEAGAVGHGGRIYILGGAQPAFGASVAANEAFKP
jgi:N-acetylneuraminic acid mutarotase